ncbi:tRNA1(Val) (adenine(37)-N6)-methyltransferase [Adhaeribacter radiodurans]|uniref:tRNA1(Val) (adenine(37)-N6)-methyltransferase n=1 Tax=Adhaeribacter radiodurans TaxID=2745197 RepID=A0A7L7L576_9BACT|nr:methyltransferase [Adhaeribacter radiodurans]QMU27961.1 methyltransferase [Adhaeribacter radiodurans]
MANSYFQFKQFRVEQDRCAMKVCTDSCLFGAYVDVETANSILDIGTGTGLLALMVAQRSSAKITAVELDFAAAEQATENFKASPWADRLTLYKGSLQDFERINKESYDIILSNPPFYQASQKSPDSGRNRAMHSTDLPFPDLLRFCQKFLKATGSLYLLLPPYEAQLIKNAAPTYQLFLRQELPVFTSETGKQIRSILHFQPQPIVSPEASSPIYIRTKNNQYTEAFQQLLQPYYLHI